MLGEGRKQNKGLVRKGRSGLIESFGPRLHWSETCYRNPVSWFPNNEISEKGFVVLWDSILTFLWFLWFSLGCLPLCSCFKSDYFYNMETLGWAKQLNFICEAKQQHCAFTTNVVFVDAKGVDCLSEWKSASTLIELPWFRCGYSAHDAHSQSKHYFSVHSQCSTQVKRPKLRMFALMDHKSKNQYSELLSTWLNINHAEMCRAKHTYGVD